MVAFRATLEELENADLLLHVVDLSNPRFEDQIQAVEAIIADLQLGAKACLNVFNKRDRVAPDLARNVALRHGGVAVSARDPSTLPPLIERMRSMIASSAAPVNRASPPDDGSAADLTESCDAEAEDPE
jgi:GTP-binding protein HflX